MKHSAGGRRRTALGLLLGPALAVTGPPGARADIGLEARFGEVVLEGAQAGRTYSLREQAKVPFGIKNAGDAETEVVVEFERPRRVILSPNYELIPDPSWMKAVPERLRIPPKGVGFFDLLLSVPDDPALKGRHFQATVKARQVGGLFAAAIENKVRFSVGPGPETLQAEKKRKAMQQLDFDVSPHAPLYLVDVPIGREWDSRKEARKSVRVANYAKDPLTVVLSAAPWGEGTPMPDGFEPIPDPSWVAVKPSTVTAGADEIAQASLVVRVPDKPEHRGRRWGVVVKTGLLTGFWLDAPVRVLLETKP
ncbi:MAG: hypothetical protein HY552_01000 [Elusimicrobia bacterium]|nr:hypothetical protein [Elusimicrobiota bacterium]